MSEPIRVLYVDDSKFDRQLVVDSLEKEHGVFRVTQAESRQLFEERLAQDKYDLVLSDFNILGIEGLQVIGAVRAKNLDVPVVIVTGTGSEEVAVEALKRGAADYVLKTPRHIQRLPATIHTVLEVQHLRAEHKRLEDQLRQSQKMEAVGRLAGGVAHDFNNLLTIVLGYTDILLGSIRDQDPSRQLLAEIKKAGERCASLTRQLLAFSRKQVLLPRVLNLNAVISALEKMLNSLLGEHIVLAVTLDPDLRAVKTDPSQIEQVILNLAVNARDAMPRGGRLLIETANVTLGAAYARMHSEVAPGSYVLMSVSDTGCGMDESIRARVFEPFFTTKEPGKGTGLGLATVYGVIKQSGGHIEVSSAIGKGTTFKIYLPQTGQSAESISTGEPLRTPIEGSESILLVEDEDALRSLVRESLRKNGYRVLEARNGGEALLICEQHNGPIHLMVSDVVMPYMSGRQLADRLVRLRPAMKTLLMSGYTDEAIAPPKDAGGADGFLQKPFTMDVLLRRVRALLER
jgi:signal transduction histidine kinase